jgi:hypothetical protein
MGCGCKRSSGSVSTRCPVAGPWQGSGPRTVGCPVGPPEDVDGDYLVLSRLTSEIYERDFGEAVRRTHERYGGGTAAAHWNFATKEARRRAEVVVGRAPSVRQRNHS